MNVTVESLAPCKKLVRVEVDAKQVDEAMESVARDFQRQASLPGFRPGKAPRQIVLKKYEKDIADEAKRKLISDSYKKAVEEQKLEVLGYPDIEEIQFAPGQNLQFAATVETAPEFELPEYHGIPVQRDARKVSEEDVEKALSMLREQHVQYKTVTEPLRAHDIAVVNFTGTCEGKPIIEISPTSKGLSENKNFWIDSGANNFIPGFPEQLMGAKAGEKRTVNVDFPADFVSPQLAGKRGVYEVEVVEIKEKQLPAVDDALAKKFGAENVEALKTGVRKDLENELDYKNRRNIRNQLITSLLNRVNFELPESPVAAETRNVVYNLVQENTKRGVPRATIEEQKEQIYSAAAQNAKEKVKVAFLLQKIAEKEDIKVSQEEVAQRIAYLAAMYQIPPQKFATDLKKRNGLIEIFDQVMNEKVLEFLQKNARIEDVYPGATPPNPA